MKINETNLTISAIIGLFAGFLGTPVIGVIAGGATYFFLSKTKKEGGKLWL